LAGIIGILCRKTINWCRKTAKSFDYLPLLPPPLYFNAESDQFLVEVFNVVEVIPLPMMVSQSMLGYDEWDY